MAIETYGVLNELQKQEIVDSNEGSFEVFKDIRTFSLEIGYSVSDDL